MRRGTTDASHPEGSSHATAPSSSMVHSAVANNSSRARKTTTKASTMTKTVTRAKLKRRICCVMIVTVMVFQVGIIVTSNRESRLKDGAASAPTTFLRGRGEQAKVAGTFNGYPIYLSSAPFHSTVHCVGETHNPETAWMYRSCEFTNLCLDTRTLEFHLVESAIQREMHAHRIPFSYVSTELLSSGASSSSTTSNLTLALGGINPRWVGKDFNQGVDKVKWFPNIVSQAPSQYYVLDPAVTLLPFHSFAAHNVGHLLWDDFLPIYTLLSLFGRPDLVASQRLQQQQQQDASAFSSDDKLLLIRVDTLPLLYGTCEMRRKKGKKCSENFEKFLPLLGVNPETFTTLKTTKFQTVLSSASNSPSWICARNAMAGLGMLTDHGLKDHGWRMPKETHQVQNTGKGGLLYQFRNVMIQNLGLPLAPSRGNSPLRIVLSVHSSGDPTRDVDLIHQQNALKQVLPTGVSIEQVELAKMTMIEQVHLVAQTHVFISTCGGGSMTATFLPKGATLVLYYDEKGGYDFANNFNITGDPAFLDWDLMNNMSYLRVHWLPIGTMNTVAGIDMLVHLIQHEIEAMSSMHHG